MTVRTGIYTFADFLELIHEEKADLLEGVIYMASPESVSHNRLVKWLAVVLHSFIEAHDLGEITINKVAYRLTPITAPEPDLAFVKKERSHILKGGYVNGPPDLAIEFVSPDSVDRDYQLKRALYEESGVTEYWIIDEDEKRALFLVNGPNGFTEVPPRDSVYESPVLPGFRLDTRWLWQRPLPPTLPIVQTLLK